MGSSCAFFPLFENSGMTSIRATYPKGGQSFPPSEGHTTPRGRAELSPLVSRIFANPVPTTERVHIVRGE